ncbi:predicted protein [Histoplasma capsulatum H143]|uniref:Uncharacterized protein n=1 Tax=Ajellomyces capsulatus (strain H143) TaxID=544712 RepID=C6HSQ4_AJECH|nr:predicted protein [Histoplasma capsulatum H143]
MFDNGNTKEKNSIEIIQKVKKVGTMWDLWSGSDCSRQYSCTVPRYDIFFHSEPSGGFSLIQRGWDLCQRLQKTYSKRRDFSRAKKKGAIQPGASHPKPERP